MGHLNSVSVSRGGNLNKNFKIQMCGGMFKPRFDWYISWLGTRIEGLLDSRAKAPPARRPEKGYGDENLPVIYSSGPGCSKVG